MGDLKDFDYWVEANKLAKELLIPDAEDKILTFMKEKNMNFNEAMLFGLQLKEALGVPVLMSRLKGEFKKNTHTFFNNEQWEEISDSNLKEVIELTCDVVSESNSLHVCERRYQYNGEVYRVIGAISGGETTLGRLVTK